MGHSLLKRASFAAAAGAMVLVVGGCSQQDTDNWVRWGLPEGASDRATFIGDLWTGSWIASMLVGAFVWGLMGWVSLRYRRQHAHEVPRQSRYNLPMEILYTLVPFLIIGVLFFFTVKAQNGVNERVERPDHTVNVIGQKWSWVFNYMEPGKPVHEIGTIEKTPDLYLVHNKTVRFNLESADVIHSFWIPQFYYKLDVIPGKPNSFDVKPTKLGTFAGKCAELCGTYHSAMLFNVHVVTEEQFKSKMEELAKSGKVGEVKVPKSVTAVVTTKPKHEDPQHEENK